jgi:hypothetical protein
MPGSAPGEIAPESEADAGGPGVVRTSWLAVLRFKAPPPDSELDGRLTTLEAGHGNLKRCRTPPLGVRRSHLEKIPWQAGVGPDRAVQSLECRVREGE